MVVSLVVDLVEGHPVLHFMLIAGEDDPGEAHEKVDQLAVTPAAVLGDQVIGHFKMRQRNDRFNTVFQTFVEQIVIKLQASLVRLLFIALRENTRPGNRGAETFEAHFGKQRQVLRVAMIKIYRLMVRVVFSRHHAVGDFPRHAVGAGGHHIRHADPLAPLLPAAL